MEPRKIFIEKSTLKWNTLFKAEKSLLLDFLGSHNVNIEHIGSTSVPGLSAKPVIDILIEIPNVKTLDEKIVDFQKAGYEAKGENGISGRRFYQKGGNNRSHHIHAFQTKSLDAIRHLAFKKYLIQNPEVAKEYESVKIHAANKCKNDINIYASLKNSFIIKHEQIAMALYGS